MTAPKDLTRGQKFQAALGVGDVEFVAIKKQIRAIGEKHLDFSLRSLRDQPSDVYTKFKEELIASDFSLFGGTDDGPNRLEHAVFYIKKAFSRHRGKYELIKSSIDSDTAANPASPISAFDVGAPSDSPEIKEFLESFSPSLLHLFPAFLNAGIVNRTTLNHIASWPRKNLTDLLEDLTGIAGVTMEKVIVEAIVSSLKAEEYET
ncbi:hypothetical protein B0H10DRAFT_2067197 [Mycena sp. CBHHK59/15]|nr:hypothetical protein B0H10DRAFT_2067197 [Mycena sp. CBHHK59/15]